MTAPYRTPGERPDVPDVPDSCPGCEEERQRRKRATLTLRPVTLWEKIRHTIEPKDGT